MKKKNEFSCLFGHNIISNGLTYAIRYNIVAKKTTKLDLLFHKKITKIIFFWPNIISNGLYQTIRNNIVAKKTTELVLFIHKSITKLVFLWPNMGQLYFKVLIIYMFLVDLYVFITRLNRDKIFLIIYNYTCYM